MIIVGLRRAEGWDSDLQIDRGCWDWLRQRPPDWRDLCREELLLQLCRVPVYRTRDYSSWCWPVGWKFDNSGLDQMTQITSWFLSLLVSQVPYYCERQGQYAHQVQVLRLNGPGRRWCWPQRQWFWENHGWSCGGASPGNFNHGQMMPTGHKNALPIVFIKFSKIIPNLVAK